MLKKMLIQGTIAAAVIGFAAAVYASGPSEGFTAENTAPNKYAEAGNRMGGNNGYIADGARYKSEYKDGHKAEHKERDHDYRKDRDDDRDDEHYGDRSKHHRKHAERDYD
ncbi:hypothetical protein L2D14_12405 [Thalassospiraceae bacterium LMO-JJ14]|nr:hypothetical protein L2D14_12405 [Thalassospiraceae bacterium LMO-JJ14]